MLVYLNGRYVTDEEAWVPAQDRGLLSGQGAFETMRAYEGRVFRLGAHLERLARTLAWLGIEVPEPMETLAAVVPVLLARNALAEARVRLTVTAGPAAAGAGAGGAGRPTVLVTAVAPGAPDEHAYRAGISAVRLDLPHGLGPGAGHKVTSYLGWSLARRTAVERGAGEAVLVTGGDRVVEGAHSNLFAVLAGAVATPPLSAGALPGITRAVVLALLPTEGVPGGERDLRWEDLERAEELFVTSSVAEVLPVTTLGGRPVGDGAPGKVTRRLAGAYRALVAREVAAVESGAASG